MDPFLAQLEELCATHPTRAKWVFVPTHAIGRTLGDRLVLSGTDWANLRFVTPLDIALRMGAPFLVERGIDPSEEELGPALMMRLLLELPLEGGYFRPLADHPTLAQALWATVRELRMAGISVPRIPVSVFESPAKHAEIVALLSAYERFLLDEKRADMAIVYEEAVKHLDWCPIQTRDCWTEHPDYTWSPLQRALLKSIPGKRVAPRALKLPGVELPRRLGSERTARVDAEAVRSPLAYLMSPPASKLKGDAIRTIDLFHAGGREAEIEEVFRRIVSRGVSLDQVEIACASEAHATLVWEKALRHDWPVTLGVGIPATLTRPGRALIGLCDWIETDFSAAHLRQLLQSGDVRVEESAGFTAGHAARVLARAEAGWGRATYGLAIGRLCRSYETRANGLEASDMERAEARQRVEQAERVRAWIIDLVASVPMPTGDGNVPLQSVVASALDFLDRQAARSSALDHRAAEALRGYLGELRALGAFSCTLSQALRFVRERVQSLTLALERPRPGHLHASHLSQAGYAGRTQIFVVGLEEGRVFPVATEDAILLDVERAAISPDLRLSTDRIDEAVYAVLSRLAVCSGSMTLSYSCRDTREFRETHGSWLMLQAFRLQQGDGTLSYKAMRSSLGEPASAVPVKREFALSRSGWWLRNVVGTRQQGTAAVGKAFPQAARGQYAEAQRERDEFTAHDGCVPEAGVDLDPCNTTNVFSVTELERAAECPFRFFLKHGLGVRPPDERERDRDVWLDALARGSELHAIYASLLRRTRKEGRRPNKDDATWLLALARERLARLQEEMPAPTPEILERETSDLLNDIQLFLEEEINQTTSQPIGLEVSFGRPLDEEEDPLARVEPAEIPLGDGLTLRLTGRIDRIDEVSKNTLVILDYKTGGFWKDKWKGVFAGGARLQHALYGLAAVELLKARGGKPRVAAAVYYFCSHKGGLERFSIPAPPRERIEAVLKNLREVIRAGQFTRTPDAGNCRYCEYSGACGAQANLQAMGKLGDPRFPAFFTLSTHE